VQQLHKCPTVHQEIGIGAVDRTAGSPTPIDTEEAAGVEFAAPNRPTDTASFLPIYCTQTAPTSTQWITRSRTSLAWCMCG